MGTRSVHLSERGRSCGFTFKTCEAALPVRPKLRRHAPAHERPAHWWRMALQLTELGRIFGWKRLGDGGKQLRHLHDRAFEAAKRGCQGRGLTVAVRIEPK